MITRKILTLTILILATSIVFAGTNHLGLPSIRTAAAAPVFAVDLSANSTSTTDVVYRASATNTHTFRVGAQVNATAANQIANIGGWQLQINYNSTLLIPQADPNPSGSYPDGADTTANFGTVWSAQVSAGQAFAGTNSPNPGQIIVYFTLLPAAPAPISLRSRTLLANVAFEFTGKTITPAILTVSNILFVDRSAQPLPNTIVPGKSATEIITNDPPVAAFIPIHLNGYVYSFDALTSTDSDGRITGYYWDFGDGTQDLNVSGDLTPPHDYSAACVSVCPALFNVTLRVVDNGGATGSARTGSGGIIVNTQLSHIFHTILLDKNPVAAFTVNPTVPAPSITANFDGSISTDDGTITSYQWSFGDPSSGANNVGTGALTTHVYSALGSYAVNLTVTDNNGFVGSIVHTVIVDSPPSLTFTASVNGQVSTISVTTTPASSTGTIQSIKVDWGDGSVDSLSGTTTTATHTYSKSGNYNVTVTSTDNNGVTATKAQSVTVTIPSPGISIPGGIITIIAIPLVAIAAVALILLRRSKKKPAPTGSAPKNPP
jgi:PKD repeat protein